MGTGEQKWSNVDKEIQIGFQILRSVERKIRGECGKCVAMYGVYSTCGLHKFT